jgi:hypothetical protein
MRTGYLFSWTALLAVGLASAQTTGTPSAPAGSPSAANSGAPAASGGTGDSKSTGSAATSPGSGPAVVEGSWDVGDGCQGGKCGLLSGRSVLRNGDGANHGDLWDTNRWWIGGEYLLWRIHDSNPPDLASLFAATGVNTSSGLDSGSARSGFRITGGYWFDETHCCGIEGSFFFMDQKRSFSSASTVDAFQAGIANIPTRIVTNLPVDTGMDLDPGDLLTTVTTGTSYMRLMGFESNFRRTVWWIGGLSVDVLAGFRYLQLDETVSLAGDFTFSEPNPDEATPGPEDGRTVHMSTLDEIQCRNQYYGGQVGASFSWHCYRLTVDGLAKFGVGGTAEQVTTGGVTFQSPGLIEPTVGAPLVARPAATLPGGILTSTPLTTSYRTRVSVVPELRASLGYQVTNNLNAFVGYNFIWWTNVAIPGDQSSTSSSGSRDIWFQGLDFGVLLKF